MGNGKVVTLAGLGTPEKPHPIQTAYVEEQVPQCGYCINGWIMTAAALPQHKKKPTDAEIKDALTGLKCRCGTHMGIMRAVKRAADDDGLREATMTKMEKPTHVLPPRACSRPAARWWCRSACRSGSTPCSASAKRSRRRGGKPPLTPDQLSSYIAVNADGTVSAFFGKMDMGQGLFTAIGQMVAEELDVPFKAVKVIMGDTATSVNQGGASGSTGIQLGGKQMRMAAAEARRVLVDMAAAKLGLPADQLTVT